MGKQLRIINDAEGRPVARAAILCDLGSRYRFSSAVCVDGFRHGELSATQGIFAGRATTASRSSAIPLVGAEQLGLWATEQIEVLGNTLSEEDRAFAANIILSCRGDAKGLPIAFTCHGWLNQNQVQAFAEDLDELLLVDLDSYGRLDSILPHLKLHQNVAVAYDHRALLNRDEDEQWLGFANTVWKWWAVTEWSAQGLLIKALSQAWKASVEDVVDRVFFFDPENDDERIEREIGIINDAPFVYDVGVVLRPDT